MVFRDCNLLRHAADADLGSAAFLLREGFAQWAPRRGGLYLPPIVVHSASSSETAGAGKSGSVGRGASCNVAEAMGAPQTTPPVYIYLGNESPITPLIGTCESWIWLFRAFLPSRRAITIEKHRYQLPAFLTDKSSESRRSPTAI